jgi:hypothetical protein
MKAYYADPENSFNKSDLNTVESGLFPPNKDSVFKHLFGKVGLEKVGDATFLDYVSDNHAVIMDLKQMCCFMDGVDDTLTIASTFNFDFFASTISFWMNTYENISANPYLFGDASVAGNYLRIVNGNEIEFSASGNVCYRTLNLNMPDDLQDGAFRHFVIQRDNEDLVLYIDGALVDRIPN